MKVFEDFDYLHKLEDPEERVATLIFEARVGDRGRSGPGPAAIRRRRPDRRDEGDGPAAERNNALAAAMGERFEALGLTPPSG